MDKNRDKATWIYLATTVGVVVSTIVTMVMENRQAKKEADEAEKRLIAHTHYVEQLDAVNAYLDRKIEIGRKALENDDVYLWDRELDQ